MLQCHHFNAPPIPWLSAQDTGAIFWRDFWIGTTAPDFFGVVGRSSREFAENNTHEAGQVGPALRFFPFSFEPFYVC